MHLITPDFGLLFWMVIAFGLVVIILKKFAWKTIVFSLKERERTIEEGVANASRVKEELIAINRKAEQVLQEARVERDILVKEGRELKERIISEAKESAGLEVQKMMEEASRKIEEEKNLALNEMKTYISRLSVEIAEKILRKKLEDADVQKEIVEDFLGNISNN
jgi:F-type H+-transporting ATPase subunit b